MNEDQNNLSAKDKDKQLIVEQLGKVPIIQLACEKLGIARSSFYRWRKTDEKFAEAIEESLSQGKHIVNDLAESQLMSAIKDGNMTAIIFWLKNNHRNYKTRIELSGKIKTESDELTPEQEELIMKAIGLTTSPDNKELPGSDNN